MKQKLTALLSALLLVALCLPGTACGEKGQKDLGTPVEHELALPQKTAYADDYSAFPRPAGETQKTVNYIDITGCNYFDLFYAITLQGIVNRENPDLYLIHDWIVQAADGSFNASKYWFDKLDESYLDDEGEPYFEKVRYTALKQLLLHYYDSVRGAVL